MRYSKRPKDGHGCPDPLSQMPEQKSVAQRRRERERQTPSGHEFDRYLVGTDCAKCGAENDKAHELCSDCQND